MANDGRRWPIATDDALTARRRFRGIADMDRFHRATPVANDPKPPSAHKGPQMLDERARLRGTPAMGRHEGVDRQRRPAPSGERLDERAALEIVADQQFGREADP